MDPTIQTILWGLGGLLVLFLAFLFIKYSVAAGIQHANQQQPPPPVAGFAPVVKREWVVRGRDLLSKQEMTLRVQATDEFDAAREAAFKNVVVDSVEPA